MYIKGILRKIKYIFIDQKSEADRYRSRGVRIGEGTQLYSVDIDGCFQHLITIGKNCTITHASIQAHDASTKSFLGYSKVARVSVGDNCFIGWNSTILPGVAIGDNVIVGAGSVVVNDIPSNSIACGVPARVIGTYEDYVAKNKELLASEDVFISDKLFSEKTTQQKLQQTKKLDNGSIGFDL